MTSTLPADYAELQPAVAARRSWRHDGWGAWAIAFCFATLIGPIAVFGAWPSITTFVMAFVIVGGRQHALSILAHETYHRTLFRRRAVNDWVGAWLCSYPIVARFHPLRIKHFEHHRKLGSFADPDSYYWGYVPAERGAFLRQYLIIATGLSFPLYVVRTLLGKTPATVPHARPTAPVAPPVAGGGRETLFLAVVQLILLGVFAVSIGWYWYVGLWLLPRFTVTEVFSHLRQFLEHRGGQLMLIRAGWLERFFLGSYNFHLHGIHHVFPQEPWYSLPALEQRAVEKRRDMWERRSYLGVLLAFLTGKEAELLAERGAEPVR